MGAFAILLNGSVHQTSRLSRQLAGRRVIAADGGIVHARALNLKPELWLGDFDSAPEGMKQTLAEEADIQTHSPMKDISDGQLALQKALSLGGEDIALVGGFGGRFDHVYLNAAMAFAANAKVWLTSGYEEAVPLRSGKQSFDFELGTTFSVLPLDALEGLSVRGARWPLDDEQVPFGSTKTLSNVVSGQLEIGLSRGRAMVHATFRSDL